MIVSAVQRWRSRRDTYRPAGERIDPVSYDVAAIPDDATARAFVCSHHYSGSYPAARVRAGRADPGALPTDPLGGVVEWRARWAPRLRRQRLRVADVRELVVRSCPMGDQGGRPAGRRDVVAHARGGGEAVTELTALFPFSGIGGGALGFRNAEVRLLGRVGRSGVGASSKWVGVPQLTEPVEVH